MKQENDDIEFNVVQTHSAESATSDADLASDAMQEEAYDAEAAAEVKSSRQRRTTPIPDASEDIRDSQEITIEDLVEEDMDEADVKPASSFSLNKALGGAILAKFIQQQFWLVLLIALFFIAYISCRYFCQQDMVQIDKKEKELIAIHYKATVFTSKMTEQSRQSNIMDLLGQRGDSTLEIPTVPPYKIYIPE